MSQSFVFKVNKSANNAIWLLFGGAVFITGYFNSQIRDPFNSPKFMALLLLGTWFIGHLISNYSYIKKNKILFNYSLILLLFLIIFFISTVKTDDKYTAFIGAFQRRNGFLMYFALGIIALSASIYVKFSNLRRLFYLLLPFSYLLIIYGYAQSNAKDFVNWNNPYNSIISTVGNPNFAAAVMAIFATISFCAVFIKEFKLPIRLLFAFSCLAFIHLIYLSNSRQGLLAFGLGISIFTTVLIYDKNKKIGLIAILLTSLISIFAVLGMLQKGPLAEILYKPSVSVRGYYWRAAIKMLMDHPVFGVGIDRYAAYFKEYREVGYPLNYGFTITSSNAHDVPLQIASTGGVFLGLLYLALISYIFYVSVKSLTKTTGTLKIVFLAIFCSWIAFQAQSIISIDNIGITIWGWLLGGILVGLSASLNEDQPESGKQSKSKQLFNLKQLSFSVLFIIPSLIYTSYAYSAEKNMWKQPVLLQQVKATQNSDFHKLAIQTLNNPFTDPQFKLETAINLYQGGFKDEGTQLLKDLATKDPRNLDVLEISAQLFESVNNFSEANVYRKKIAVYDQFNAVNYLKMGKNYKALGDKINQEEMLVKILSFAPNTPEAATAKTELSS